MIHSIMRKEILHIIRDPRVLGITLFLPLFQLIMFGYALSLDVDHIKTAVYDSDRSVASRRLIESFSSSGYFDIVAKPTVPDFADRLDNGAIKTAVIIPNGFEQLIRSDSKAKVQVLVDGSDPNFARLSASYATLIINRFSSKATAASLYNHGIVIKQGLPPIETKARVWYNPELKSVNFIVPGLMALILMTVTTITISVAIVREKERGTLENIIISPVRSKDLVIGKIIPYVLIAFIEALVIVLVSKLLFNIPINGSLLLMAFATIIYVAGTLGIGLVISAATDSQQVASLGSFLVSFLPAFLLSGFVFPIKCMPVVLQALTYIVPAMYFLVIVRGV
ncbi:MAG: ABC transporter permease, partial [Rubrobacteridae bacterium]|nr:ABC transporter permease [Rubrobacteridae bacterium]